MINLTSRLAELVKSIDRRLWPKHRVSLTPRLAKTLEGCRLVVADVGAASGPEESWQSLAPYVHFVTFDPVERSETTSGESGKTHFGVGLAAEKGSALLYLTKDADASTLYRVNTHLINDFHIHEGLEIVGSTQIELDSLDNCLSGRSGLMPDFLKIDVEGADLDVLRGARKTLAQSVLAVKVEVSFVERHVGAPLFGETDGFLRVNGFILSHLSNEYWIRRNLVYGFTSQPQLIWGDAIYFLSRESLLKRLSATPVEKREELLVKFVVILLSYGAHDFAMEVIEAAVQSCLVPEDLAGELRKAVESSMDRSMLYFLKCFAGVLFAASLYACAWPIPRARQRAASYVKQRAGRLFYLLWRATAHGGPQGSCISDNPHLYARWSVKKRS